MAPPLRAVRHFPRLVGVADVNVMFPGTTRVLLLLVACVCKDNIDVHFESSSLWFAPNAPDSVTIDCSLGY